MKLPIIAILAGAMAVSGCLQADDLVSSDVRQSRQEIRQQGYMHMSCADLRRQHTAASPARSPLLVLVPTSVIGREVLSDIEAVMKKKGCKVSQLSGGSVMNIPAQFQQLEIIASEPENSFARPTWYEDPTTIMLDLLVVVAVVGLYLYARNNKKDQGQ